MNAESSTALMPRATVALLVARRNAALEAFGAAHTALTTAAEAVTEANKQLAAATPGLNSYNQHLGQEKAAFHKAAKLPSRDDYMATARRIIDTDVWSHIIAITDLERLMDKKAKDQFRQQLVDDPPEVTEDNVFATLEQFMLDAETIFKRGIAECFSNLDRRFRSHDGWEIGSRIILSYAFDSNGWWNYHRNHQDTFADIERVFRTLDDNPAQYCEIIHRLDEARRGHFGPRQSHIETQYFTIRAYKNGNAHVWFKRDELLERVNQLLGEYYGAPIPEDRDADEDTGLNDPKTTPAKRYGFFPTPDAAADSVMREVALWQDKKAPRLRVLEPSAGTGNLARRCVGPDREEVARHAWDQYRFDPAVDCIEIQPALADALRASGLYHKVYTANFLSLTADTTGLYDRVVMNPPFDRERDIDHVMHALKFLKPGGVLVAVMSAGTEFRNTRKSQAFRKLMEDMRADWRDLPAGSFSSVGTNCNTRILKVCKPESAVRAAEAA